MRDKVRIPTILLNAIVEYLPPSSAEVKNAWSYTSTPKYVFMAWCFVDLRDNFTFYLYFALVELLAVLPCILKVLTSILDPVLHHSEWVFYAFLSSWKHCWKNKFIFRPFVTTLFHIKSFIVSLFFPVYLLCHQSYVITLGCRKYYTPSSTGSDFPGEPTETNKFSYIEY
jgi:hypothetical protein